MTLSKTAAITRVHRRQFVVGPQDYLARPDWLTFKVRPGLILSADPELRISATADKRGAKWFLLGLAVDVRPDSPSPTEQIAQCDSKDVPDLHQNWSGRWVLIGEQALHLDAAAMLNCYYGKDSDDALWASSSPVLIERALRVSLQNSKIAPEKAIAGKAIRVSAKSGHKFGHAGWQPAAQATIKQVSWYPPPHSSVAGASRLLPSQILNLHQGTCRPRSLVGKLEGNYTDDSICEDLRQAAETVMRRLAEINAPNAPTLLLSGGRDSRLLISIAAAASIPLKTYTRVHRRATFADRLLPQKLARKTNYPHRRQFQRKEIPGRRQAILEHAGYNVSWLSSEEFLRGGSDPLKGIALAGFCAELGRDCLIPVKTAQAATGEMLANHFQPTNAEEKAHTSDNIAELASAFDDWIAIRKESSEANPDDCIDLCDYFFIEQRTAGRKGAKEQIFDLFPAERVAPLNSFRVFTLIGHLSNEFKRKALWINRIIEMTSPELLEHPMNPPNEYFGPIAHLVLYNRLYTKLVGLSH